MTSGCRPACDVASPVAVPPLVPAAAPGPAGAGHPVTGSPPAFRVTGHAQQQAWRQDLLPPVEEVRPGLWSIPVTWPGSPLRYTLAYVLSYRDGVALVNTGWPTALLRHHRIRLAEIEHAVAASPGMSTWAVAESLTWSRGWQQTRGMARLSAISETLAHLVHLESRSRVVNADAGTDAWAPGPRASAAD